MLSCCAECLYSADVGFPHFVALRSTKTSIGIVDVARKVMHEERLAGQHGTAHIDLEAHSLAQLERSKAVTVHGDGSAV